MLPFFFFFNDTATTAIYTLSLHDALPISFRLSAFSTERSIGSSGFVEDALAPFGAPAAGFGGGGGRSEEHTSELQSHSDLVCRLLLEKKKQISEKFERMSSHGYR